MRRSYAYALLVCGGLLLVAFAYLATIDDLSRHATRFVIVFGMAFVVYVAATFLMSRMHEPYRRTVTWLLAVAVALRIVCLVAVPTLSDDIYRYVWEGRVVATGDNPFAKAPDDPSLSQLRDDDYASINHRELETIYPPFAQGVFALGALLGSSLTVHKVLITLFDLGTIVLLLLLLRQRGRNLNLVGVYAWSPLVVVEFSHSGHVDAIGIFSLLLAVYLLSRGRTALSMAALALSFLSKYLSALLVPFFLVRRRYLPWLLLFGGIVIAGYLPFVAARAKLFSSLYVYGENWEFNSLIFRVLKSLVSDHRWIRIAVMVFVAGYTLLQARRQSDVMRYAFLVIGCALLLSPTVYPWYVTWIVPFLCFFSSRAWLALTGLVALSYLVWNGYNAGGAWQVGWGLLLVEYLPFYGLLALEWWRHRRSEA